MISKRDTFIYLLIWFVGISATTLYGIYGFSVMPIWASVLILVGMLVGMMGLLIFWGEWVMEND